MRCRINSSLSSHSFNVRRHYYERSNLLSQQPISIATSAGASFSLLFPLFARPILVLPEMSDRAPQLNENRELRNARRARPPFSGQNSSNSSKQPASSLSLNYNAGLLRRKCMMYGRQRQVIAWPGYYFYYFYYFYCARLRN